MNTRNKIIGVVVVLILMGGSFWGGMTYAKSKTPARGTFTGQFGGTAGGRAGFTRGGTGAAATTGQVVSASGSNVTIKLASGSTQLVLLGTSTQIAKSVSGMASDLLPGTTVIITGQTNSDGSMTAQSVQIRPAMPVKQ